MNVRAIIGDIKASIKNWYRNKAALFWTFAFPILLILLFGTIFSGGSESYILYVQDMDDSPLSHAFIQAMENISALDVNIITKGANITEYAKKHAVLYIPAGFFENITHAKICNITLYLDPSKQQTNSLITGIISSVLNRINLQINNAKIVIGYREEYIVSKHFEYIDFFLPGIIGMTIMTSAIYGSIEINVKYRKRGILKKLLTTPLTRGEWIFSKMMYQLIINFISSFSILAVGIAVFHVKVYLNVIAIIVIVSASFAFTGIGMLISRFVNEEETADSAASAINFPMMFLAGTFFPLEIMPSFLQAFAKILPLYYVNEGLRNAMIFGSYGEAIFDGMVITIFAFIVFGIGVLITKWKA